ncbi:MAG: flippase [Patescibacteria group bacterium]
MRTTLKKGTMYLTVASGIFIFVGYLTNILLGRFLGPVDYGNYGVIVSLISLVNIIQTSGLTQSVAKYIAQDEQLADEILKSAFTLQLVVTGVITILFFLLAPMLAALLNDESLTPYLQLASASFPVYGMYALYVDYANGRHFFKKQALLNSLYSVTKAIGVVSLGYLFHLKGVLWGFIIAPFFSLLIGFYYPRKTRFHFPYKKLILFSLPLIGYTLFSTLLQSIDLYFVKSLLSPEASGFYTASQSVARILYFGTIAFSSVLLPSISHSVQQKLYTKTRETIALALRIILLIIAPITALIAATSKDVLLILYSAAYIPASSALSLLIVSFVFFTLFTLLSTILIAAGKPKIPFVLAGLGLCANALLCFLLIPQFFLSGAAIASLLSNAFVMILAAIALYHQCNYLFPQNRLYKIIGTSLLLFILAKMITVELFLLPFLYLSFLSLYVIILIVLKEITDEDFSYLTRIKV